MKPFHLAFHGKAKPNVRIIDLLEADAADLPTDAGAYVLGTDGTMLVYPWATSPIYYIGKADNLRQRLLNHRKHILGAVENYWDEWWWPRYQYGAAFGASCVWFTSPESKSLEAELVDEFYERFGSIPVANANWPKTPEQD